jgi:hypothetical protein
LSVPDLINWIAVPLVGWLLLRINGHGERLVRIETKLDLLLPKSKNSTQQNEH